MQREKRFLLDVEGEDVRHRTETKELEIKHHQFVQNTDLLTHENALINQMIIQDGRYPKSGKYPWQMNEEELTQMGIEEAIKASEMQVIQPDDFSPGKPQTYEEAREIFKNTTTPFVNTDKLKYASKLFKKRSKLVKIIECRRSFSYLFYFSPGKSGPTKRLWTTVLSSRLWKPSTPYEFYFFCQFFNFKTKI